MRWTIDLLVLLLVAVPTTTAAFDPVPLPGVQVVAQGCSPCRDGDRMTVTLQAFRPGVAVNTVELRATVRTPQGQTVKLPPSGTLVSLPAGLSSVSLLDATVGNEATGVYIFEGAILDPVSGVTVARHTIAVVKE
jgi:hypothetical protein